MMKRRTIICTLILFCMVNSTFVLAEPSGNSTQTISTEWFENFLGDILTGASEGAARFASMALRVVVRVISTTYGLLAIVGALLWASNIDRNSGKRLIIGSLILLIVAECATPLIGT
ncbi:MAG: hypothetical protein ACUVTL_00260 [Thermoproteota archaeon]